MTPGLVMAHETAGGPGLPTALAKDQRLKLPFSWMALGVGLLIALLLLKTGALAPEAARSLPLLTLLIVAEFGFFLTAIGAGLAIRHLLAQGFDVALSIALAGCVALAGGFLWLGLRLWPAADS
jgi:hypothetical protein